MEVIVKKQTDEMLMRRACEMTFNGTSRQSLLSMYKCEHSPVRTQLFWVEFDGIPLFVATHFIRHHVGSVPFELTRRDDRSEELPFADAIEGVNMRLSELRDHIQWGEKETAQMLVSEIQKEVDGWRVRYDRMIPVKLGLCINAQSLIDMSKVRLCCKAHPLTVQAMERLREEVCKVDESLGRMMVRKCVYRGGICGEAQPCGYNHTAAFRSELSEYLSVYTAAQRPDEDKVGGCV